MDRLAMATAGLFYAWLANDAEEYVTMLGLKHPVFAHLGLGTEPDGALSRDQVDVAPTMMGAFCAAASVDGYRTGGRSPFYRAALYGDGMHGFIHLARVVAARGYATGSATALPVILPFWSFANCVLRASGIKPKAHRWAIAPFAPVGLVVHYGAKWIETRLPQVVAP